MTDTTMPSDEVEAERRFLGAILASSREVEVLSDDNVDGELSLERHRILFAALQKLSRALEVVDRLTAVARLRLDGQLAAAGGGAYIYELAELGIGLHVEGERVRLRDARARAQGQPRTRRLHPGDDDDFELASYASVSGLCTNSDCHAIFEFFFSSGELPPSRCPECACALTDYSSYLGSWSAPADAGGEQYVMRVAPRSDPRNHGPLDVPGP